MIRLFAIFFLSTMGMHGKEVTVTVTGVRNTNGVVAALFFDKEKGFPSEVKMAAHQGQVPAKAGTVVLKFKDVPAGRFAVSVLHDEDKDKKLATNFLGIPREGVGVSNGFGNARPKFAKAVVEVKPGDNLTIALQYP
jgi:uncharacterized protein (DUF2141 family)